MKTPKVAQEVSAQGACRGTDRKQEEGEKKASFQQKVTTNPPTETKQHSRSHNGTHSARSSRGGVEIVANEKKNTDDQKNIQTKNNVVRQGVGSGTATTTTTTDAASRTTRAAGTSLSVAAAAREEKQTQTNTKPAHVANAGLSETAGEGEQQTRRGQSPPAGKTNAAVETEMQPNGGDKSMAKTATSATTEPHTKVTQTGGELAQQHVADQEQATSMIDGGAGPGLEPLAQIEEPAAMQHPSETATRASVTGMATGAGTATGMAPGGGLHQPPSSLDMRHQQQQFMIQQNMYQIHMQMQHLQHLQQQQQQYFGAPSQYQHQYNPQAPQQFPHALPLHHPHTVHHAGVPPYYYGIRNGPTAMVIPPSHSTVNTSTIRPRAATMHQQQAPGLAAQGLFHPPVAVGGAAVGPGEAPCPPPLQDYQPTVPSLDPGGGYEDEDMGEVCHQFVTQGYCSHGDGCWYAHPDPSHRPLCKHFLRGYCRHGKSCWFQHPQPLRPLITNQPNRDDKLALLCLFALPSTPFGRKRCGNRPTQTQPLMIASSATSAADTSSEDRRRSHSDINRHSLVSQQQAETPAPAEIAAPLQKLRQTLARLLLPAGVQRQFEACIELCKAWPAVLQSTWPSVRHLEPPAGPNMKFWRGVKKTDETKNFVVELDLMGTGLFGPLPEVALSSLRKLQILDLGQNMLTGTVPPELGLLANLEGLYLFSNHLTGHLPSQLGNLILLQELELQSNQLSGRLPPHLAQLRSLRILALSGNLFTGPIPSEYGLMGSLTDFSVRLNTLEGPIPSELGQLQSIRKLYLHRNKLTGPLPSTLGRLTTLETLWLSANRLTGKIPCASLGGLTNLETLSLANNAFVDKANAQKALEDALPRCTTQL